MRAGLQVRDGCFIALLSSISLSSSPAFGQSPGDADAHFKAAMEAKARGDNVAACRSFAASHQLEVSIGTAMNLAECRENAGRLLDAKRLWAQASSLARARKDPRADVATARLAALSTQIPKVTVALPDGAPSDSKVTLDGAVVSASGAALELDPGDHQLRLDAPGHESTTLTVSLSRGAHRFVRLDLGESTRPLPPPPPPPAETREQPLPEPAPVPEPTPPPRDEPVPAPQSPPEADHGGGSSTLGNVLLYGGLGVFGFALIGGIVVIDAKSTVDDECDSSRICSPDAIDAAETGKRWSSIANWSAAIGGAAAVTGLVLVLTSSNSGSARSEIRPTVAGGSGVTFVSRF